MIENTMWLRLKAFLLGVQWPTAAKAVMAACTSAGAVYGASLGKYPFYMVIVLTAFTAVSVGAATYIIPNGESKKTVTAIMDAVKEESPHA